MTHNEIYGLLEPDVDVDYKSLIASDGKLVHYTSAEVAVKVIRSGELWFTNVMGMNDMSEAKYAMAVLQTCHGRDSGEALRVALASATNGKHQDMVSELLETFGREWIENGYVACLSRQRNGEDSIGRLSMWRSYGGAAAVAIVLNARTLPQLACARMVGIAPVFYSEQGEIDQRILALAERIMRHQLVLRKLEASDIHAVIAAWMFNAISLSKSKGFHEEDEFRLYPHPSRNRDFRRSVESVRGIPQLVLKLPFAMPRPGQLRSEVLDSLLNRIIVGPSRYQRLTSQALIHTLTENGFKNAASRVVETSIPLRPQ